MLKVHMQLECAPLRQRGCGEAGGLRGGQGQEVSGTGDQPGRDRRGQNKEQDKRQDKMCERFYVVYLLCRQDRQVCCVGI